MKKKLTIIFASVLLLLLAVHVQHRYRPSFNFRTGEFSAQDQKTFEYWGCYWNEGRPYPYHDSVYYIEYYFDVKDGARYGLINHWRFNSNALHPHRY
jgi:hypothetical protein